MKHRIFGITGTALLVLCLLVLPLQAEEQNSAFSKLLKGLSGNTQSSATNTALQRRVPFSQGEVQLSFAPLVKQTAPSVVNVYAERMAQQRQSPFEGDPFFEQFFGRKFQQAPQRMQSSLGSGVIVDKSGVIVTNFHVIEGADQIKIALPDGREFKCDVMLADKQLDLAVLKINAGVALTALPMGDSDAIAIGDLVLAIGNPFGVGQTTTSGIISATARSQIGVSDFGFFIQTDASINPGNSGGALIGMDGQLLGINSAIFSRGGGSNGIGFAIPSNMVKAVVAQAASGAKEFQRPWIGAEFEPVTPDIADALGMERPFGAIVTSVAKDGPSAEAGLKAGDVVLAVNGTEIQHPDALGYRLVVHQAGETIELSIRRKAQTIMVPVTLTKKPEGSASGQLVVEGQSPFAGAVLGDDGKGNGVPIIDIARGSPAENTGFQPGDRIVALNGNEMATAEDVIRATSEETRWWRFTINRNGAIIKQMLRF
jgi:Do/DeqQ family serine protease